MSKKREIILTLCGLVEAVTNLSEYLGALNSSLNSASRLFEQRTNKERTKMFLLVKTKN